MVVSHGQRRIEGRRGQIEQAVVIKVFHDRPSGHVESVDLDQVSNVPEFPDVELGSEKRFDRNPVPRIDFLGVFTQRHVGHVQQPADILIVRKLARYSVK